MADAVAEEKKTMFTEEERRSVIEDILIEMNLKGRKVDSILAVHAYIAYFDHCGMFIQFPRGMIDGRAEHAEVHIWENFASDEIKKEDHSKHCMYGLRKNYIGSAKRLFEIRRDAPEMPRLDGTVGSGATGHFRVVEDRLEDFPDWVLPLREVDHERFDRFLAYVRREIQNTIELEVRYINCHKNREPYYEVALRNRAGLLKFEEAGTTFEELFEKVVALCSLDPEGGANLLRRKPVYEFKITEEARRRLSIGLGSGQDVLHIERIIELYNARLAAEKRKLWEALE